MRRWSPFLAVFAALVLAAPAAAEPGETYHGTLSGARFTCHGAPVVAGVPRVTGGTWNLAVAGASATLTVNVFYDGSHHLSFGVPHGVVTSTQPLTVEFWGGAASATVAAGAFSWSVPDLGYACPGDAAYDGLTYTGPADR